jgi:hypothetical protein
MRYALVKNNKIVNIIEADQEFIDAIAPQWQHIEPLDTTYEKQADIGWDCINGVIIKPQDPEPVEPTEVNITRLAFLSRFTDAEAIAIDLASIGATTQAAAMRSYMSKVNAATFIDLKREDTRLGVQHLETVGLLGEGRALQILDAPARADELYRGV